MVEKGGEVLVNKKKTEKKDRKDIEKNDNLYEMVQKTFGINRKKFKEQHKERLAKMAGVTLSEYCGNQEQNERIRKRMFDDDIIPLHDYNEALKKFSPANQEILTKSFTDTQINNYISNMTDAQIQKVNELSSTVFLGFMRQEIAGSETKVHAMKNSSNQKVNDVSYEIMGNLEFLSDTQNRLEAFLKDNTQFEKYRMTDQEAQNCIDKMDPTQRQKYQEIEALLQVKYGKKAGEQQAREFIKITKTFQKIVTSTEYQQLDKTQKNRLEKLLVDFYEKAKEVGIEMIVFWSEQMQTIVKEYMLSKTSIDNIQEIVVANIYITEYFQNSDFFINIREEDKDILYYDKLMKLYAIKPEKEITDLMQKKDKTKQEKDDLKNKLQEKIKKSDVESLLKKDTIESIQQETVETCLNTIKNYMDIDISEEENMLQQLKFEDRPNDLVQKDGKDVILTINGSIGEKSIKLYYNMTTGTIDIEEFLARDGDKKPFTINDAHTGKKRLLGIQLPKFDDFLDGAKQINYRDMINNASNLENYQSNVKHELKNHIGRKGILSIETEKNIFQKSMVKNIVAKEIFSFMGKDTEINSEVITQEKNPIIYNLYSLISNSLEYYTINELQQYRKYIQILATKKQNYLQYRKLKDVNKEKYLLGLVGDEKILRDVDFQREKNSYALFFDLFKIKIANKDIIDLQKIKTYTENIALEVNQDQSYLIKQKFDTTLAEFENYLDVTNLLQNNDFFL